MAKPTSLEHQSFVHILQHFEKFPLESLSLLPLRIRQRFLLSAPVADVYQLEHTRFVKGIDMAEVWKTMCEQRLPLIPSLPDIRTMFGDETPPQELMKTAIAFQILHVPRTERRMLKSISQRDQPHSSAITSVQHSALFSILLKDDDSMCSVQEPLEAHPGLFQPSGRKRKLGGQEDQEMQACHLLVPSRYATYETATSDDNTKKVEEFVTTTCQALPSVVFIDCSTLKCHHIRGDLPIRGELLRKVQCITLSCHVCQSWLWTKNGAQPISAVLTPLLHHSSSLRHITFGKCSDERIHVITSQIARLLTSNTDHTVERMSISVSDIGKSRDYGFCGNAWDGAFQELERKSQEASRNLGLMITQISSLHTLKLKRWWTRHSEHAHQDHVNLLDILCSFLKQPYFQCLALADTCLPLVYIQRLVRTFLLSPCSQPQTLQLEMSLTSRLGLIPRLSGYYPSDKEMKLPQTEWNSQGHSKAALEFKTLTIVFRPGGKVRHRKGDPATLEAAKSWLLALSRFKYQLKSLIVHGDPCIA